MCAPFPSHSLTMPVIYAEPPTMIEVYPKTIYGKSHSPMGILGQRLTTPMTLSQAVLPVAGFGTRFLPWTKVVPKELLPIGNVPIISLLVDECLGSGVRDICFIISRGKEAIPQYFEKKPHLEKELQTRGKLHMLDELVKYDNVNFHVVYQDDMKGDGHALLQAADWVDSDAVAVLFGDDIIKGEKSGLKQLGDAYQTVRSAGPSAMLCLQNVERELVSKYGIVDIEVNNEVSRLKKIKGLVEKPHPKDAPSTLSIVGKYIIPRSIFDVLPKVQSGADGEIRLIDALIDQLGTINIYGYEFEGRRFDTGTPKGYKQAVKEWGAE